MRLEYFVVVKEDGISCGPIEEMSVDDYLKSLEGYDLNADTKGSYYELPQPPRDAWDIGWTMQPPGAEDRSAVKSSEASHWGRTPTSLELL